MVPKYKIGDLVWIVKDGKPIGKNIRAIKQGSEIVYLFDEKSCGGWSENQLYDTEKNCKLFISNLLSQAKFKKGDVILVLKETYSKKKEIIMCNIIKDIRLSSYGNKIRYDLEYEYEDYYDNNIKYADEEFCVKVKDEYIKENFEITDLMEKYTNIFGELNRLAREISKKTEELTDKIEYTWRHPKKREFPLFGERIYNKVFEDED